MTPVTPVHDATLAELDPATLYRILALRSEVFVLEQRCAYLDPDARDLEPDARLLWVAGAGREVAATLRLLADPGGVARIGRVATAASARGRGLAARLMTRGLELVESRDSVLEAQAPLEHWYGRFGYVRCGDDYDEDGIAHVPMRRRGGDR